MSTTTATARSTTRTGNTSAPPGLPCRGAPSSTHPMVGSRSISKSSASRPTLRAAAQSNASYGGFSFNVQIVGVFGYHVYDDVRRVLDSYQLANFRKDLDPWSTSNTNAKDPRLAVDQPSEPTVSINNMAQTSRWLENASYVRLRNIELGYNLPHNTLNKAGIANARIYISGQNLLTIT